MAREWQELTRLTQGKPIVVDRVRLVDNGIVVEGPFELPLLARMSAEDQVFVAAFVRCHGSIKHMEKAFGVSYPTIKNRLNRITQQLQLVHVEQPAEREEVLDLLEAGEISVDEAAERLQR